MNEKISDKLRIEHAMQAVQEILAFTVGKTFQEFQDDSMLKSACMHQLSIIGDAFANLSPATKQEFTTVDWKGYIGLRIKVVHVYFGIDYKIIWNVITDELPNLYAELSAINDKLLL